MNRRIKPMIAAAVCTAAALVISGCGQSVPSQRPVDMERVAEIRNAISAGTGGGAVAVARPDPTDWATLKGSFKFDASAAGQFAQPEALAVGGDDAAFCGRGGAPVSKALLVKPSGEIENIVIFLGDDLSKIENQAAWVHQSAAPGANTEPVVFDQKACVFLKPVVTMQVSQPLQILNSDGVGHNTKLENSNPISEIIPIGGSLEYNHTRGERQPYPVSCNIHPWMKAFILVRSNGYFAQTDANGQFAIENLPAGVELTMKVWHEKVGFIENVTVNGESTKWPKRGFKIKLTPDGETNLDVVVDAGPFAN